MRNYCPWVTFSGFKVITVHIRISGFLCIFILVNNTVLGYITWNFYWSYKHYRVTSREVHFIFEYPKFRTKLQTYLWAIKNNLLLKYFEIKLLDAVHLDAGGGMFPPCGLLRLSLHRHRGQVSPLHALNRWAVEIWSRDIQWTNQDLLSLIHISRQEHPPGRRYHYNNKFQYNDTDTDGNRNRNWRFLWGFLNNPVFLPHTKCLKNKRIS